MCYHMVFPLRNCLMASLNKWSEAAATATVQLQEKYVLYSCEPGPFDHIPRKMSVEDKIDEIKTQDINT